MGMKMEIWKRFGKSFSLENVRYLDWSTPNAYTYLHHCTNATCVATLKTPYKRMDRFLLDIGAFADGRASIFFILPRRKSDKIIDEKLIELLVGITFLLLFFSVRNVLCSATILFSVNASEITKVKRKQVSSIAQVAASKVHTKTHCVRACRWRVATMVATVVVWKTFINTLLSFSKCNFSFSAEW